ncbi:MAG: tRNA nucleotidyltransferase/poly(A) polymerase family protein [Solirubrobacteraceae bacterium]
MRIPPPEALMAQIWSLPAAVRMREVLGERADVALVGGAVRDLLLGVIPLDLDLVVEGDARDLARQLGGALSAHERFGTCTIRVEGLVVDLAGARRERYPRPGALPAVEPASLAQDLGRRDFTVNALAVPLGGPRRGALLHVEHAIADLARGQLRVLHERSFLEDPTRLWRLARYGARLGFEVESRTRELVDGALAGGALETVSPQRLGNELRLLAREPDPLAAFGLLHELGLARALDPRFGLADPELARRALDLLPRDARGDRLVLALAVGGLPSARSAALLDRLGFEAPDRDAILAAASAADELCRRLTRSERPSQTIDAVGAAGPEAVALAGALGAGETAREWLSELRHLRLAIDGRDLIAAGVPEGPAIGAGLRAALAAKADGSIAGREAELAEAVRAAGRSR